MHTIALQGFKFLSLNQSDYKQICEKINVFVAHAYKDELHHFENIKTGVSFLRPNRNTDLWCQPYLYYDNEVPSKVLQDLLDKSNEFIISASMGFPTFQESEFLEKVEQYNQKYRSN